MSPEPLSYLNNRFLPAAQAALPLTDLGFIWGATAVDRLRTFRQKLFRLDDHLQRFRSSCEKAFIPQPRPDHELATIAQELIEANAKQHPTDTEFSLLMFATPGNGLEPTLGMQAIPLDFSKYVPLFQSGASLEPVACSLGIDPTIKHRSRLVWWIAQEQVSTGHPLFMTTDNLIRETPIANFLAVIDGTIVSPPRSTILNGISLQVVQELANSLGIPFIEREMSLDQVLDHASECILTNTSYCLAPVGKLAGRPVGSLNVVFQRLIKSWSELVEVDILSQILK